VGGALPLPRAHPGRDESRGRIAYSEGCLRRAKPASDVHSLVKMGEI
jgi:hypothetical protein